MRIVDNLALVLSGGSFKVMFQIYLLIFLEQRGIYPKEIFAISGGVPNALSYILKKAWKLPHIWPKIEPHKLFEVDWYELFILPLLQGTAPIFSGKGIFKSGFLESVIKREVDFEAVLGSPIVLWVGVVDLAKGSTTWVSNKDVGMTPELFEEYVIASMRIPVFFRPHEQKIDLGLVSNLAIHKAVERSFENILAINALPVSLEQISGVENWPESNLRHDDIQHVNEATGHVKLTEWINHDVLAMEAHKRHWWIRLGSFLFKSVRESLDGFYFPNKRYINLCVISPPSNLQIFRKWVSTGKMFKYVSRRTKVMYGYPSLVAREELLEAGKQAVQISLVPFLKKNGIDVLQ